MWLVVGIPVGRSVGVALFASMLLWLRVCVCGSRVTQGPRAVTTYCAFVRSTLGQPIREIMKLVN